jgi:glycosyltransferase involved in cell wall biosynthesis/FixJ family two-component response regulator
MIGSNDQATDSPFIQNTSGGYSINTTFHNDYVLFSHPVQSTTAPDLFHGNTASFPSTAGADINRSRDLMFRVLYVDDEETLLDVGKMFLEKAGNMSVDTENLAPLALERLQIISYDAIVSDYRMPGMDGITFLREVRRLYPNLPFILFTGRGCEATIFEAINNGVDYYLEKSGENSSPFTELKNKIYQAIQQRKKEKGNEKNQSRTGFAFGMTTMEFISNARPDPACVISAPCISHSPLKVPIPDKSETPCIRTLVAMPAYNEEGQIAKTIISSRKYADAVLVVDDGSHDATVEIARELKAIVVRHEVNKGYGGALQTIFETARTLGAEELVIIDADGQHNPDEIPLLFGKIREGLDVAIGSRFIGNMQNSIPAYRKIGMKLFDKLTTVVSGKNLTVSDSQSGFRAYGKKAIEIIKISGNSMGAGSEILVSINEHNLAVGEVPIRVRYDLENTSSQNPLTHGFDIVEHLLGILGYKRPLVSFGLPGFVSVLAGLVMGSWAFAEYQSLSKFSFALSMSSIILVGMGILLIANAFTVKSLVQLMKSAG